MGELHDADRRALGGSLEGADGDGPGWRSDGRYLAPAALARALRAAWPFSLILAFFGSGLALPWLAIPRRQQRPRTPLRVCAVAYFCGDMRGWLAFGATIAHFGYVLVSDQPRFSGAPGALHAATASRVGTRQCQSRERTSSIECATP